MESNVEKSSTVEKFARSFKGYGISLGIILSFIPFVSRGLDLLPIYSASKDILTFFATLFCLLAVALLFSLRRRIGTHVFPSNRRVLSPRELTSRKLFSSVIPGICVFASCASLIVYIEMVDRSVDQTALDFSYETSQESSFTLRRLLDKNNESVAFLFGNNDIKYKVTGLAKDEIIKDSHTRIKTVKIWSEDGVNLILRKTPSTEIRYRWVLYISYVLMFLCAAIAFVWLGLIEYIQETLNLDDKDLLINPYRPGVDHIFKIPDIADQDENPASLFFMLGYSQEKDTAKLVYGPEGPFCQVHAKRLEYGHSNNDGTHTWKCTDFEEKKKVIRHTVRLGYDFVDLGIKVKQHAARELDNISGKIQKGTTGSLNK